MRLLSVGGCSLNLRESSSQTKQQQHLHTPGNTGSNQMPPLHPNKISPEGNTRIEIFSECFLDNDGLGRWSDKNGDLLHYNDCLSSSSASSYSSSSNLDVANFLSSEEDDRFPVEKWKTFLVLTLYPFMMIFSLTCIALIHDWVPQAAPLPDVLFGILPEVEWALDACEIILIVSLCIFLLLVFIHKHRFIIFRRFSLILALLFLMRCATMVATQVPVASTTYYCSPKANSTSVALIIRRVWDMLDGAGFAMSGSQTYCGDYIYSGHTAVLTVFHLTMVEYTPRHWYLFHWATWLSSATGILFLILSRGHYTIDVIIAYYVTTRVFWIYHTMANNQTFKQPSAYNYLSRSWWFFLFSYFECNVGGVVPWQCEWPLHLPLHWSRSPFGRTRIS